MIKLNKRHDKHSTKQTFSTYTLAQACVYLTTPMSVAFISIVVPELISTFLRPSEGIIFFNVTATPDIHPFPLPALFFFFLKNPPPTHTSPLPLPGPFRF